MTPLALLQAAAQVINTPPPQQSGPLALGEWLALIALAATLGGIIYKAGVSQSETRHLKSSLEQELKGIREVLAKIGTFIDESIHLRLEWAGFRRESETVQSDHTKRLDEHDIVLGKHDHKFKSIEQAAALLQAQVTEVERRTGAPGRRQGD